MKILLHIFYKEWIKTRWAALASLAIGVAVTLYIFTVVANKMTVLGAKVYTLQVLYDNPPVIYYSLLMYIPLLIALCVGITQYLPEVNQKRIRLTLHLPVKNNRLILYMALYGVVALTVANIVVLGLFMWKNIAVFPDEVTMPVLRSLLPYFLVSYPAYNFIAMIAMEPNRWRQLIYTVIALLVLSPFMVGIGAHGANFQNVWALLLMTVASFPLLLYTSHRFNKGEK